MNNTKPIMENQKPVEIVQEITWEKEIEVQEQELQQEIERTDEERIYVAEIVNEDETYFSDEFAYIFEVNPRTEKTPFRVRIKLENCYLTDASALGSFLWFHDKISFLPLSKVEKVKELLEDLETDYLRMVNHSFGYETEKTSSLKRNLIKQLKEIIRGYENGGTINLEINLKN